MDAYKLCFTVIWATKEPRDMLWIFPQPFQIENVDEICRSLQKKKNALIQVKEQIISSVLEQNSH